MRHLLCGCLYVGLLCASAGTVTGLRADDQGFSRLNAVGRYLGVGYSHYGYHSGPNGRLQIVQQNHPASAYPSTYRPSPFQPAEFAYRPQAFANYAPQSTQMLAPSAIGPTKAPELAPVGPPPKWLEPYLKENKATLPTPAPKVRTTPVPQKRASPAVQSEDAAPIDLSPSDRPIHRKSRLNTRSSDSLLDDASAQPIQQPKAQRFDDTNDQLLDGDDDQLLDDDSDSLLDEAASLQAAGRNHNASSRAKVKAPDIQSNIHRYTPFR